MVQLQNIVLWSKTIEERIIVQLVSSLTTTDLATLLDTNNNIFSSLAKSALVKLETVQWFFPL